LGGAFFKAFRAGAAGALRAGTDAFDFAAIFFDFATALAMAYRIRKWEVARLTPFWRVPRKPRGTHFQRERVMPVLQMQPFQEAHADEADKDQVDRDNEIEKPRHDENEDARDQGHDGRNVRGCDDHCSVSGMMGNRVEGMELSCIAFSSEVGTGSRKEDASNK
jgi:hypothetical protein